jgi:Mg2+ and Co2+ transporter CorA
MTIICRHYDLYTYHTGTIDQSQVTSSLKQEQALLWIEMKLPSAEELDWLGQTFSLHPATVKSVQEKHGYPSFDWREDYYVFKSTAVHFDEQHLLHQFQTHQTDYLNILVNRLTVVTIILSTAAVITGFYGINVGGLYPNTNNSKGALIVLAFIIALTVIQFVLLRPLWKRKS